MRRYLTIVDYVDYGSDPGQEYYGKVPVFGDVEVLAVGDNAAIFIASLFYREFELAEVTGESGVSSLINLLNMSAGTTDFSMN